MKKRIFNLFKEMLPIILGILIALILNNWNEERKERNYIRKILNSVEKELLENKNELTITIAEHRELIDTINVYMDKKVTVEKILEKANGIRGVSIKNTAWQSIVNSKLELVDYESISILTDINEGKQDYKLKMEKLTEFLYTNLQAKELEDFSLFKIIINDLLNVELDLEESHKKFLSKRK